MKAQCNLLEARPDVDDIFGVTGAKRDGWRDGRAQYEDSQRRMTLSGWHALVDGQTCPVSGPSQTLQEIPTGQDGRRASR
jgi:hypothetical protein